jgi:hypothetical protein
MRVDFDEERHIQVEEKNYLSKLIVADYSSLLTGENAKTNNTGNIQETIRKKLRIRISIIIIFLFFFFFVISDMVASSKCFAA